MRKYWILLVLVIVKLVMQYLFVNPVYELHRDEFLHLDQAMHPAWGYISVPPFTSWFAMLIYFLGGGIFWIRFIPALFGALTVVFGWLIAQSLGGKLMSKVLTSVLLIFSVYVRLNLLFQPNAFDILAWTMMFWFLVRYLQDFSIKWLIGLAVVTALSMYNKYTVLFLIAGLLTGLLLTRQRTLLVKKKFWLAIALSCVLFLPNIIWQIVHDFPVLRHMQALKETQLVNVNRIDFLADQIKFGLIGIPALAALWALLFYKPFKPFRAVAWAFITVLVLFTLSRAKSYYAVGLYPVMFAFGSVYLESVLRKWNRLVLPAIGVFTIALFFVVVKFLMPVQSPLQIIAHRATYEKIGLLRWEDGKNHHLPQDFADMVGWKEMSAKALEAWNLIPFGERANTLIFCENYGQTGALNYYNRGKMPSAYSFSTDYIWWLPSVDTIKNIVFVGDLPGDDVLDMFADVKVIGEVENENARERGTKIILFTGANSKFTNWFYATAEKRKREFDIF